MITRTRRGRSEELAGAGRRSAPRCQRDACGLAAAAGAPLVRREPSVGPRAGHGARCAGDRRGPSGRRRGRRRRRKDHALNGLCGSGRAVHRAASDGLPRITRHLNVQSRVDVVCLLVRRAEVHPDLQETVPLRRVLRDEVRQGLICRSGGRHRVGRIGVRGGRRDLCPAPVARRERLLRLKDHQRRRASSVVIGRLGRRGRDGSPCKRLRRHAAAGDLLTRLIAQANGANCIGIRVGHRRAACCGGAGERRTPQEGDTRRGESCNETTNRQHAFTPVGSQVDRKGVGLATMPRWWVLPSATAGPCDRQRRAGPPAR